MSYGGGGEARCLSNGVTRNVTFLDIARTVQRAESGIVFLECQKKSILRPNRSFFAPAFASPITIVQDAATSHGQSVSGLAPLCDAAARDARRSASAVP